MSFWSEKIEHKMTEVRVMPLPRYEIQNRWISWNCSPVWHEISLIFQDNFLDKSAGVNLCQWINYESRVSTSLVWVIVRINDWKLSAHVSMNRSNLKSSKNLLRKLQSHHIKSATLFKETVFYNRNNQCYI